MGLTHAFIIVGAVWAFRLGQDLWRWGRRVYAEYKRITAEEAPQPTGPTIHKGLPEVVQWKGQLAVETECGTMLSVAPLGVTKEASGYTDRDELVNCSHCLRITKSGFKPYSNLEE